LVLRSLSRSTTSAPISHHCHLVVETDVGETITVGTLPGQRPQLDPLLVASHYDGPQHSIGVDVTASGLATLIELVMHWAAAPPRRTMWVVTFDQEEWGRLVTSALELELKARGQKLPLMVRLEMIAYTSATLRWAGWACFRCRGSPQRWFRGAGRWGVLALRAALCAAVRCCGRLHRPRRSGGHFKLHRALQATRSRHVSMIGGRGGQR
jgi:hypothetical protein